MSDPAYSKPTRVLVVLVHGAGDAKGRAMRFADGEEIRFGTLAELTEWLRTSTPKKSSA